MAARITGRDRMRKVLKALPDTVRKRIRAAIIAAAEDMAASMRVLAPVDRGDLRDSIEVTPGDENPALYNKLKSSRTEKDPELAAIIHVDDFKARFVEYGTVKTPAQRFFWPSYRAHKKKAQARINKAARQGIKDGLK